eukprot:NODE_2690_length_454_cov_215.106173_g2227_i0.p1 GENE.NODE_2690_length_454_cov_215.106173_g2227_i0~~NODE_2690_length_454_cov_215.106173_g2227_i0.p1  ORF type:complete len:146 (+),score=21.33 NODE_2690_length_454_cov_215.106173_g2227_i0:22-438(+)
MGEPRMIDAVRQSLTDPALNVVEGDPTLYSPYFFPVEKFRGLPPLFFTASEEEPPLDEIRKVVELCIMAGVQVEFECKPYMPHVYPMFYSLAPESADSMDRIVRFLQECLEGQHSNYPELLSPYTEACFSYDFPCTLR